VRILSLLPSATEIVFALGLGDSLVGVTAECDEPAAARRKPAVSFPTVAHVSDPDAPSASQVDATVTALVAEGAPLYRLDEERIRSLRPDLILAQDLCRVCAVPSGDVTLALDRLGCRASVLSLDPSTLDEVIGAVVTVADAAGVGDRGRALARRLRARVDTVRRSTVGVRRRRVLELEWSDPPYVGGHWVPDMVDAAGGEMLFARAGSPSTRVAWDDVAVADDYVVAFAPCGYGLAEAVAEAGTLSARPELARAREIWALDGSAYFSRPGPRVVDGVELLASILHPDLPLPVPPPGRATRLR
jgi:iron complex transport system substrate-binding protein